MKEREPSEARAPRIRASGISFKGHGKKMERTKEILKRGSEKQEINHTRGVMKTKRASFSRREKPAQLNGSVQSCRMRTDRCPLGWVITETINELLSPVSVNAWVGKHSRVSQTLNKKKNWGQPIIHQKEKGLINKFTLWNVT